MELLQFLVDFIDIGLGATALLIYQKLSKRVEVVETRLGIPASAPR
jgi:hypothetical protein